MESFDGFYSMNPVIGSELLLLRLTGLCALMPDRRHSLWNVIFEKYSTKIIHKKNPLPTVSTKLFNFRDSTLCKISWYNQSQAKQRQQTNCKKLFVHSKLRIHNSFICTAYIIFLYKNRIFHASLSIHSLHLISSRLETNHESMTSWIYKNEIRVSVLILPVE